MLEKFSINEKHILGLWAERTKASVSIDGLDLLDRQVDPGCWRFGSNLYIGYFIVSSLCMGPTSNSKIQWNLTDDWPREREFFLSVVSQFPPAFLEEWALGSPWFLADQASFPAMCAIHGFCPDTSAFSLLSPEKHCHYKYTLNLTLKKHKNQIYESGLYIFRSV